MKLIAPSYYPAFRCIADKCRHSCCIGWEIDIDPDTRARYRRIPGPFGERLNAAIADGEVSSFRLGLDERCPMLNENGLCDLITELGEGRCARSARIIRVSGTTLRIARKSALACAARKPHGSFSGRRCPCGSSAFRMTANPPNCPRKKPNC